MDSEDSRFLLFVTDRLNASILAGERLEVHEAVNDALYDLDVIGDERRKELSKSISRRVKSRAEHSVAIRNKIEKTWGQVLSMFDECIATAEELNAGFIENLRSGISWEKVDTSSVRRYGSDQLLGGATLKILLLAGLQARACTTATEIGFLLKAACRKLRNRARGVFTNKLLSHSSYLTTRRTKSVNDTMTQRVLRRCNTSNHTTATPKAWAGSRFETKT
jgi:hypothetical protein